jgi:hypothetical protein
VDHGVVQGVEVAGTPLTAPAPTVAQATESQQDRSNQPATLEWRPVRWPFRDRLSAVRLL